MPRLNTCLNKDMFIVTATSARHGSEYGTGREAVTAAKQRNIIKAAQIYAVNTGLIDNFIRFDVIEVDLDTLQVEHIMDAFRLN